MTEHKFTDGEIIRALECCRDFGDCSLCPYAGATFEDEPDCAEKMHTDALDLINRQKAEIERLNTDVKEKTETIGFLKKQCTDWCDSFCKVKAEAIKEFAERVKKSREVIFNGMYSDYWFSEAIDNLVKEMTEGKTKT